MKKIYFVSLLCILISLFAGFLIIKKKNTRVIPSPLATERQVTLTGELDCLPHKDTSNGQTLECTYGLKTPDHKYYALDSTKEIPTGKTITVSGLFVPIEMISSDYLNLYNVEGILKVESLNP